MRAMSITELIDATFTLYRNNFALFAGIVAVLSIPETIINMIFASQLSSTTPSGIPSNGFTTGFYAFAANRSGAEGLIGFVFSVFITGALATAVAARFLDRPMTIGDAYLQTGVSSFVRLFLALLVALVVVGVPVGLIFVLFLIVLLTGASIGFPAAMVIPAVLLVIAVIIGIVYVGTHFYLVPQAIVLEQRGVFASCRRSWFLVHGYFWHVFWLLVLVNLLVSILSSVILQVVTAVAVASPVVATGLSGVLNILLEPISLGVVTLLYFDQRIRKEGFDLEYQAGRMALSPQ
jgi:hypothetical protein